MEHTFDADGVIERYRRLLQRIDRQRFPEHLVEPIRTALAVKETRANMMHQLLLMCDYGTRHVRGEIRLVGGRLLHTDGASYVVWGTEEHAIDAGFQMHGELRLIGNKPCWTERSVAGRTERVNWAGRVGTAYPEYSIDQLRECSGVPAYTVNHIDPEQNSVGFVVVDGAEGMRYERVEHLAVVAGMALYVARSAHGREVLVWGSDEVPACAGYLISRPIVINDIPYMAVRPSQDSRARQLWRGREIMLGADDIEGPSAVGGKLAYAAVDKAAGTVTVTIGDESRTHVGWTLDWYHHIGGVIVYTVNDGTAMSTYANFVRLCDGRPQPNAVRLLEDGVTLRVRLEGEREPSNFDLKALGIL